MAKWLICPAPISRAQHQKSTSFWCWTIGAGSALRYEILEAHDWFNGSLFIIRGSLDKIGNMDNLVKWLSSNIDPRLRHTRTSLEFGFLLPEAKKGKPL